MGVVDKTFPELAETNFSYDVDGVTLFSIIAQIQVASRHPANTGPSAALVRNWALDMQKVICEKFPDLAIIFDMGWNPDMDV